MISTNIGLLSLALIGAGLASGATITVTESATASGALGSTPFTNTLVTLTATGDTSNVTEDYSRLFDINGLTISINIASLDTTATLTDTVYSFQGSPAAGFSAGPVGAVILLTNSSAFGSYELTTSIGPITGSSYVNSGDSVSTSEGSFDFTSAGNSTFTATVAANTPEPTTMALFGLGFVGLAALKRWR